MRLVNVISRFNGDDSGGPELSTVLIVALISVPLIIAVFLLARWAITEFDSVRDLLRNLGLIRPEGAESNSTPVSP